MNVPFSACAFTAPGIALLFACHVLLAVLLAELMVAQGLKAPRRDAAFIAFAFAVLFADVATMAAGYLLHSIGDTAGRFVTWSLAWPVGVHVALVFFVAVFALVAAQRLHRWRVAHITPGAVKEALDKLPQGLCFADADGIPYLVNAQMERLSFALLGKGLADADVLWSRVGALSESAPETAGISSGGSGASGSDVGVPSAEVSIASTMALRNEPDAQEATVLLDGTAWLFARRSMCLDDGLQCWQITADDVTVEYELNRELARRNERLRQMGKRLRAFSHDVQGLIREQEIVQAKAMVHDQTGRVLLATAHYLECPDAGDAQAVLNQWRAMADLLLMGADNMETDEGDAQAALDEVVQAASSIGVTVRIEDTPPASGLAMSLALRALGESVVNACKHAQATCVTMRVLPGEAPGFLHLEFSNDGLPPDGPIRETGGLAILRQQVQHVGGAMHVEHAPAFKLVLELPE